MASWRSHIRHVYRFTVQIDDKAIYLKTYGGHKTDKKDFQGIGLRVDSEVGVWLNITWHARLHNPGRKHDKDGYLTITGGWNKP